MQNKTSSPNDVRNGTTTSSPFVSTPPSSSSFNSFEKQQNQIHKLLTEYPCDHLKGVKQLNILLLGEKGAGKSSLLSTMHRALHTHISIQTTSPGGNTNVSSIYGQPPIAGVGMKRTEAFTKKKKGYKLNVTGTIVGHDTKGLESFLKPEIEQIKAIRDGKISDDVEIKQKSKWGLWDYFQSLISRNPQAILDPSCLSTLPPTIQDLPHAVIFVVPANQRQVPKEMENFVNLFTEYGYKPLFAVTKIDCHGGQPGDIYAATQLYDSKKQQLLELFEVEFAKVKPIQNYTQWQKRDVSIENLALDLLHQAVKTAEQFISQYETLQESTRPAGGLISQLTGGSCVLQ